jgi:hypothetical protein
METTVTPLRYTLQARLRDGEPICDNPDDEDGAWEILDAEQPRATLNFDGYKAAAEATLTELNTGRTQQEALEQARGLLAETVSLCELHGLDIDSLLASARDR